MSDSYEVVVLAPHTIHVRAVSADIAKHTALRKAKALHASGNGQTPVVLVSIEKTKTHRPTGGDDNGKAA